MFVNGTSLPLTIWSPERAAFIAVWHHILVKANCAFFDYHRSMSQLGDKRLTWVLFGSMHGVWMLLSRVGRRAISDSSVAIIQICKPAAGQDPLPLSDSGMLVQAGGPRTILGHLYAAPGSTCCWGFYSDLTFSLHRVSVPCRGLIPRSPLPLDEAPSVSTDVPNIKMVSDSHRHLLVPLIASFHLTRCGPWRRHMSNQEVASCLSTYIRRVNRPITTPIYARYISSLVVSNVVKCRQSKRGAY
jgi:hypothetical protein